MASIFSLVLSCCLLAGTVASSQSMSWAEGKAGMDYLNTIRANPAQHNGTGTQNYWTEITVNLTTVKATAPLHWSPDLYTIVQKKAEAMAELAKALNRHEIGHIWTSVPASITGEDREYLTKGILYFAEGAGYPTATKGEKDFYGENCGGLHSGMNVANPNVPGDVAKAIIRQLINDYNAAHNTPQAGHRQVLLGISPYYRDQLHFAMDVHKFTMGSTTYYTGVVLIALPTNCLRVENFEKLSATDQPYCWLLTEWKGDQLSSSPLVMTKKSSGTGFEWTALGNGNRQMWMIEKASNGRYRLFNHDDASQCLSADTQGNLSMVAKADNNSQLWTFEHIDWKNYDGMSIPLHRYWILNVGNSQALDYDFTTSPKQRMTGMYWEVACWPQARVVEGPMAQQPRRP